jgi:23S rRNA (cytosine1962-C5)-methyltransferase
VTFIDSSKEALDKVKRNLELNNFSDHPCEFFHEKTFEALEKLIAQNRKFEIVILDPPAFVKSKKDLFAGLRGYEKLTRMGVQLLKENGILLLASCSHNVSLADLTEAAANGLRKGLTSSDREFNRQAKLIRTHGASFDHPLHPSLKESEYLKSIAFMA